MWMQRDYAHQFQTSIMTPYREKIRLLSSSEVIEQLQNDKW